MSISPARLSVKVVSYTIKSHNVKSRCRQYKFQKNLQCEFVTSHWYLLRLHSLNALALTTSLHPPCFRTTWCNWANCCWQIISFPAWGYRYNVWSCLVAYAENFHGGGFVQGCHVVRGAARMRPKKPRPPRKNLRFFAGVSYQSQLFGNKRKKQSDSCSVVFSHWPRWLFAIGCETIRLTHATLLAKLPINGDNTSRGVAWMKCKGANSDERFLRGLRYLHEVLPNQIEIYLVKTWSTPSAPRNGVLCSNAMFLTARLALWLVGMRSQVEGSQFWNVQQVTVSAAHKLC